jgi:hypothetical protein
MDIIALKPGSEVLLFFGPTGLLLAQLLNERRCQAGFSAPAGKLDRSSACR